MIKKGEVILTNYNNEWPILYEKEIELLMNTLGDSIFCIEHVGSTSIPGLKAKPIIDIVIGLKQLDEGFDLMEKLSNIGYIDKGSLGKSKCFFLYKLVDEYELYHLHLVEYQDNNWNNLVLFRNYLINHIETRMEYQVLKENITTDSTMNRELYTKMKTEFIIKIIELAKNESGSIYL